MDIKTPKGQVSLEDETKLLRIIKDTLGADIIETPKHEPAIMDGFIVSNSQICAMFESKCRYNLGLNDENKLYDMKSSKTYETWLISYAKIDSGRILANALKVPFYGFLYLVDDSKILVWNIANKNGQWMFEFEDTTTITQKCINGGSKEDRVAYLPVGNAILMKNFEL